MTRTLECLLVKYYLKPKVNKCIHANKIHPLCALDLLELQHLIAQICVLPSTLLDTSVNIKLKS